MKPRNLALALAAGTSLLAATPVFADPGHGAPAYGWRAAHRHPHYYYRAPAYVYVPARPVVVVPPPVAYVPGPPVVYVPAAPVLYGHVPVAPGVRVSFGVRL
ncbi:MAG TPA: hypothetical protein VMT02_07325 [Burkholderiales bacterium]|nr:hypothetical protein [Burkholderiales bacterium]